MRNLLTHKNYYSQVNVAVSCDMIEEYAKSGLVEPIENVTVDLMMRRKSDRFVLLLLN